MGRSTLRQTCVAGKGNPAIGDVEFVIIDPISSYMLKVDSHRNTDVRSVLEPIGEMAERLRVGILLPATFQRGWEGYQWIIGSIAFVAAARAAFTVVEDPDVEGRRLFLSVKNNIAPTQRGLAFRLEQREVSPGVSGSFVAWDENVEVKVTADQVLSGTGTSQAPKMTQPSSFRPSREGSHGRPRYRTACCRASLLAEGKLLASRNRSVWQGPTSISSRDGLADLRRRPMGVGATWL